MAQIGGASQTAYGYTGEYQDSYIKLIYLRSRWYDPASGRFPTRDLWQGDYNRPLSFNRWLYGYGNPVNLTDPSGRKPEWCQSMPNKAMYELCVLTAYGLEPISFSYLGETVRGEKGCYTGPTEFRAPGYIEGLGGWFIFGRGGREVVYDFATMERQNFTYLGGGINDALDFGGGGQVYVGAVNGFRTDSSLASQYRAFSGSLQIGVSGDIGIGVGGGGGIFWSWTDFRLHGGVIFVGWSLSGDALLEGADIDFSPILHYTPDRVTRVPYSANGEIRKSDLINDILVGKNSPAQLLGGLSAPYPARAIAAISAMHYADVYMELKNEDVSP